MEFTDLPLDLFLSILAHLSARTVILCRRVSQTWKAAFTTEEVSLQLLKDRFPRCRELRLAYLASGGDISALTPHPGGSDADADNRPGDASSPSKDEDHGHNWATTFALVARRYHHLRTATPRSITKLRLGSSAGFFGVAPWSRHLQLNGRSAPFHHPNPSWCYSQDLGLLVYHVHRDDVEDTPRAYIYPWRLLDVQTGVSAEIAFPHDDDRVVRRVRLADGVLLFEWCERTPYYCARDGDDRHRHYATALDVVRVPASSTTTTTMRWDTVPRAEWFLFGMRMNQTDRFLSAHTASHYALYLWQGVHDGLPVEHAMVWDMSAVPPGLVRHLDGTALWFYGVRQKRVERLRELGLDGRNLFFLEEEHRWSASEGGRHHAGRVPRAHLVRSTGVPVIPGPVERGGEEGGDTWETVEGPRWRDECGADGDVHLSFCTRIDKPARPCFEGGGECSTDGSPGIWNGSLPAASAGPPTFAQEIHSAVHAYTARWPGWAPCWRHEDFPYLTTSEMVDFKAGVRIVARNCFMLETLSLHTRPSLSVRGPSASSPPSKTGELAGDCGKNLTAGTVGTEEWEPAGSGGDEEVHFADEMWEQLLGAGYICGDERWLIGESDEMGGGITIVRF